MSAPSSLQELEGLSLRPLQAPSLRPLQELQCHYTWDLDSADFAVVRDLLLDVEPEEGRPWRGQIENLLGFFQDQLGHPHEARRLFSSASTHLTGPALIVHYSDRAWFHHRRGESEERDECLRRVRELRRQYHTEEERLQPEEEPLQPEEEEPLQPEEEPLQPEEERLPPELLAEKAFTLMNFGRDGKQKAVELFERALREFPDREEWRSSQAIALLALHKEEEPQEPRRSQRVQEDSEEPKRSQRVQEESEEPRRSQRVQEESEEPRRSQMVQEESEEPRRSQRVQEESEELQRVLKIQEALQNENLYLSARLLFVRAQRGEQVRTEAAELMSRVIESPCGLYSGLRVLLRIFEIDELNEALHWADEALKKHPESRYVKSCAANTYRWIFMSGKDKPQRPLGGEAVSLLQEVIKLYPDSERWKINLALVYTKRGETAKAEQIYQDLLLRDLSLRQRQELFYLYGQFLHFQKRDREASLKFHLKAAKIPVVSKKQTKSVTILQRARVRNDRLRREIQDFLSTVDPGAAPTGSGSFSIPE